MEDGGCTPGVSTLFRVNGEIVHSFESSPPKEPKHAGKQGEEYAGKHDHGTMPEMKQGGPHGAMIEALLGAKADSDAYLTGYIEAQKEKAASQSGKKEESIPGKPQKKGVESVPGVEKEAKRRKG